jgi:hypothetical protein
MKWHLHPLVANCNQLLIAFLKSGLTQPQAIYLLPSKRATSTEFMSFFFFMALTGLSFYVLIGRRIHLH